jgi:hypothetical protein
MDKEEFINSLDIPFKGEWKGNDFVINLTNSDDFSTVYNIISNNPEISMEDNSITTTNNSLFTFFKDEFEIRLTADFNRDIYKLTVGDR